MHFHEQSEFWKWWFRTFFYGGDGDGGDIDGGGGDGRGCG